MYQILKKLCLFGILLILADSTVSVLFCYNKIMEQIIGVIMWIYGIISQIMTLVFFIDFCKTDSFLQIIFIDTWLSELKGLLWIFFV